MKLKFFIIPFILLAIYWQWWLAGPRVATDFSLTSQSTLKSFMDLPQTWSVWGTEGLGEYTVFTLWSWPYNFLIGIFANLGFSFSALERILIIVPFLLIGIWSIKRFGEQINLSNYAKFISILFYLINTYILLVIDGGQLTIALAYAFFPLAYLKIEQSIHGGYKERILAGLSICVVGFFDIRFIYALFLLGLIRFLYEFLFLKSKRWSWWILRWLKTGLTVTLIIVGLNFYWLFILFKAPLPSTTYSYLTQTSSISLISLGHAILLLSPHWFKNVFGNITVLHFEFILIPILVFLAPILRPKNRIVAFWLLIALISIFLTKGSSEPFSKFYPWLYSNIAGFSLFRDSSKFFFLVSLSYTALIGITTDEIIKRINKSFSKFVILILAGYLIFLVRPVWLGLMTGTFSTSPLQKEYSTLSNLLRDQTPSNVFWIPTISPLTSLNSQHPSLEAARLVQKRPFAQATMGTYEIFNYLREAPYMGQLFDVANIGYIVYPFPDFRRESDIDKVKYYYTFLGQLSKLPWLERINNSAIPLLKVKHHQDKFFITPDVWYVLGSDSIYNEATKSSHLKLAKNALIFAEEYPGLGNKLKEFNQAKIVLNHKGLIDLAASFISENNMIFPARYLDFHPDSSGWWKREAADLINWRDFLQTKYGIDNQDFDLGGGWAIGEGSLKLKIQSEKLKQNHILLARVLESTRSGELKFYQNDKLIGQIDTKKLGNNIRWFELGELPKDGGEVEISSIGEINVVNALAVLDKNEWLSYQDKARRMQGSIVNFDEKNAQNDNNPKVSYNKINPTKYIIDISGLTKPAFLVFSQNYDKLWKLENQPALPVYSLLNGFKINQDGEYILEFEPQKNIAFGLTISALTLLFAMVLLLV